MKTWKLYADEILRELAAVASGRPRPSQAEIGAGRVDRGDESVEADGTPANEDKSRARDAVFMVTASDLSVPPEFTAADRARSLYYASAIRYDRERDGRVQQDILFFGPYVPLPAGRYLFSFDGEIDGELHLAFTGNTGETKITETMAASFARPIPVDLPKGVAQFEIVGTRTQSLKRLVLRGVFAELRGVQPQSESGQEYSGAVNKESARAAAAIPALQALRRADGPVYAVDDDGRALVTPYDFSAERMRVHDIASRVDGTIVFDGKAAEGADPVLFFGPYLRLEPGLYSFRFRGALSGSLKLRLTSNFSSRILRELVITGFQAPVELILREPADKVEIIGERTRHTRAMRLQSIEIAVAQLRGQERPQTETMATKGRRFLGRAARLLRMG